ncbi:MAG: hypothetical protein IJX23_04795 [Clostridia bacterium]|nr:hypothetical protein [Clostridia bacterium]
MIFPSRTKIKKGKSIKVVADFSATQQSKGKIVMQQCGNVNLINGLKGGGGFLIRDSGVFQYMPGPNGQQSTLTSAGITVGSKTYTQLVNCQKTRWVYDTNNNALVVCGNNTTYRIAQNFIQKIFAEAFDSIALCQSRLFGLKGNRVHWSYPTVLEFDDSFWVDLPTSCVALVNNGELYALGNDVYKIEPDGDEGHFVVRKICSNVGNILGDTACAYGNKIMFVANGKLFSLQHGGLKELASVYVKNAFATMHCGLYYLFGEQSGKNVAIAYNPHSGKVVYQYDVTAQTTYSDGYNLYASDGQNGYLLTYDTQPSYWKSQPINFDDGLATMYLHRLLIQTSYDLDVYVTSDKVRTYTLKGKDVPQSLLLTGQGKNITVEVRANGNMNVGMLCITARTSEVSL